MKNFYEELKFINIKKEQWSLIFLHISIWLMIMVAFYIFLLTWNEKLPSFIIILYSYGFLLFYLNYLFLTPYYLLPKKYFAFIASILIIILFSFLVVDPILKQLARESFIYNLPPEIHKKLFSERLSHINPAMNKPVPSHAQEMIFLLFAFLASSSSVRIFQKLKREEDINKQYHHEKLNAELMMLRQQVNPHFLFNSLNNILSLVNSKSDSTVEAIVKLSAILRHMLSENVRNEIPLTSEIELIQNYIDLQKLWMKNTIKIDFLVENIKEGYYIEPFILNPLVENAFKYGTLAGVESIISIHINIVGDWLHFMTSNPVVLHKLSKIASMGIGVNNVIRRLELCYFGNYKIEINQELNNYVVHLSIKLSNNEMYSNR